MFRVNGMQIMMTAGDTGLLAIVPREGGYIPNGEDRAVFTVREKPGRRAVMEKTIVPEADGRVKIEFASADTARLNAVLSGFYPSWRPAATPLYSSGGSST